MGEFRELKKKIECIVPVTKTNGPIVCAGFISDCPTLNSHNMSSILEQKKAFRIIANMEACLQEIPDLDDKLNKAVKKALSSLFVTGKVTQLITFSLKDEK